MYTAPTADLAFALACNADLDDLAGLPGFEHATPDLVETILDEAAKLARDVIAPLNPVGDRQGCRLQDGVVTTPEGTKAAYQLFVEGGWNSLPFAEDWGGQGLPASVALAMAEIWNAASQSFGLCPLLTTGAVEALERHGSARQKELYLPNLVAGTWTGTMNLTEAIAGSDVGALRTRAVREGDHYRITGQKIFITYGEHDLAENIIHLVLARLPDAPSGSAGISLFLVPKYRVNPDGSLGARNDVQAVSLEHKLGIHASPTAIMAYGDAGGAWGELIGQENHGLECMFTMMNSARLNVGLQGIAISERAYQQARDYAKTRIQGKPVVGRGTPPLPIIWHPDVRRMLLLIKSRTEAARALACHTAGLLDRSRRLADPAFGAEADLLIPVVKAWATDLGVENASLAVQIHGGAGFIEETGAAQHYRDARIAPIYEGTNGIQALDLLGRKLARDQGAAFARFIARMRSIDAELATGRGDDLAIIRVALQRAMDALDSAGQAVLGLFAEDRAVAIGGATPFLRLFGITAGGWALARQALAAQSRLFSGEGDPQFNEAKLVTARFYAEQCLPETGSLLPAILGGRTILACDPEWL